MEMPNCCFLCASNEGVLLNCTSDNIKTIRKQVETCLSTTAYEKLKSFNKICYKCAYELNECNTFVEKYKKCRAEVTRDDKCIIKRKFCTLCHETVRSGYMFDISQNNHSLNNPLFKIQQLFNEDLLQRNHGSAIICLNCRYNLDVLFDLKNIYQEITKKWSNKYNQGINYSELPKISTIVVKRKITTTDFMKVKLQRVCSDSDSDSIMKTRGQDNIRKHNNNSHPLKTKSRVCDKCHTSVKSGTDMYRFHQTGWTVCKECWTTIDPSICSLNQNWQNSLDTKMCSVFLKDILIDKSIKDQKLYRIEKDSQGNPVYIVTNENKPEIDSKLPKDFSQVQEGNKNVKKRLKRTIEFQSDNENNTKKKLRCSRIKVQEKGKVSKAKTKKRSSYSDTDVPSIKKTNSRINKQKQKSIFSSSDIDSQRRRRRNLKKLRKTRLTNVSEESSSSEDIDRKKIKTMEFTRNRNLRFSLFSTKKTRSTSEFKAPISKKSPLTSPTSKPKSPSKEQALIEINQDVVSEEKEKYTCNECGVINHNKLAAVIHELTHSKQLTLKLHKVGIPDKIQEKGQTDKSYEMNVPHEVESLEDHQNRDDTDKSHDNVSNKLQEENKNQEDEEKINQKVDLTEDANKTSNEVELENSTKNKKDGIILKENEKFEESNEEIKNRNEPEFGDSKELSITNKAEEEKQEEALLNPAVSDTNDLQDNNKRHCATEEDTCTDVNNYEPSNSSNVSSHFKNHIHESYIDEIGAPKTEAEKNKEKVQEQVGQTETNLDVEDQRDLSTINKLDSNDTNKTNVKENEDLSLVEQNDSRDKDVESEIDIKIVDTDSSESSTEPDFTISHPKSAKDEEQNFTLQLNEQENASHQDVSFNSTKVEENMAELFNSDDDMFMVKDKEQNSKREAREETHELTKEIEEVINRSAVISDEETCKNCNRSDEIMKTDSETKSDTSQNVSSKINSNADMPSLDPITTTEMNNEHELSHEM